MSKRLFWIVLAAIVILSFGVRLVMVGHGLPYVIDTDEGSDLSTAMRLTQGELPKPHVRYHRSLIAYIDAVGVGGLFAVRTALGQTSGIDEFQALYFADRALFTLATRLLVSVLAVLSIALVALIGSRINERVGLFAALVVALNGFYAANSVFALPDAVAPFFLTVFIWLVLRLWERRRARDYILAGLALALVMLSKISGSVAGIGFVIVHGMISQEKTDGDWRAWLRSFLASHHLWLFALAVIVGNVLFNPLAFINAADITTEIAFYQQHFGGGSANLPAMIAFLQGTIIPEVWRWLLPLTFLGLAAGWRHRRSVPYWVGLVVFGAISAVLLGTNPARYKIFYWMGWLPFMAILTAVGIDALLQWAGRYRPVFIAAVVAVGLVLVSEAVFLLDTAHLYHGPDTRDAALHYLWDHIPPDTRIISGPTVEYSVPVQRNVDSIGRAQTLGLPEIGNWDWWLSLPPEAQPVPAYDLYGYEYQAVIDTFDDLAQLIADEQIAYVIEADLCQGGVSRPDSDSAQEYPPVNEDLRQQWELVAVFSPYDVDTCLAAIHYRSGFAPADYRPRQQMIGPMIRIYRVSPPDD